MFTLKTLTDLCKIKQSIKKKKHFCVNCLKCFGSKEILTNHKKICLKNNSELSINMPKKVVMYSVIIIAIKLPV